MQNQQYQPNQAKPEQKYEAPKTKAEVAKKLGAPNLDSILDDIGAAVEKENLSNTYRQHGGQ